MTLITEHLKMFISLFDMFIDSFEEDFDPSDFELVFGHGSDVGPFEVVLETLFSYLMVIFLPTAVYGVGVQPFSSRV
jgi:hypothetical protein